MQHLDTGRKLAKALESYKPKITTLSYDLSPTLSLLALASTQGECSQMLQATHILRLIEAEAAYVGLYYLAWARYPLEETLSFWRRMAAA